MRGGRGVAVAFATTSAAAAIAVIRGYPSNIYSLLLLRKSLPAVVLDTAWQACANTASRILR